MVNEKRLIYLEDAKDALIGWETDPTDDEIEYTLDSLPKVDAVEVVHGRWIENDACCLRSCSVCGFEITDDACFELYGDYQIKPKRCLECGAKMDGDGNG